MSCSSTNNKNLEEPTAKKTKRELTFSLNECPICGDSVDSDSFKPESDKIYKNIANFTTLYLEQNGNCQEKYKLLHDKDYLLSFFLDFRPTFHFECLSKILLVEHSGEEIVVPIEINRLIDQNFLECFVCNNSNEFKRSQIPQRDTIYYNCIKLMKKLPKTNRTSFGPTTLRLFEENQLTNVLLKYLPRFHKECWKRANELSRVPTNNADIDSKLPLCFVCNEGDVKNELIVPLRNTIYTNCYKILVNSNREDIERSFCRQTANLYFKDPPNFIKTMSELKPFYHRDCWNRVNNTLR